MQKIRSYAGDFSSTFSENLSDGKTVFGDIYQSVSEQLGDFEAKAGKANTTIKSGIDSIEDLTEKNAQILNHLSELNTDVYKRQDMNSSIIRFVLGNVLKVEAVLMLLPCIVAVLYQERTGFAYLLVAAIAMTLGTLMTIRRPKNHVLYLKEGCVATARSWIFLSFFGALPFWISGEIPSLIDALFETVSGFTTTGASILSDVEAVSHCALFWRSCTHWIGGMGVLVFLLAVIPLSGGSHINLMRAESPGPSIQCVKPVSYTHLMPWRITTKCMWQFLPRKKNALQQKV